MNDELLNAIYSQDVVEIERQEIYSSIRQLEKSGKTDSIDMQKLLIRLGELE